MSGDGSPPAGSRDGAPVGVWGQARFVAESVLRLPYSPPKTWDLRESHDPTRPGQGGHVSTRGYAIGITTMCPHDMQSISVSLKNDQTWPSFILRELRVNSRPTVDILISKLPLVLLMGNGVMFSPLSRKNRIEG